VRSWASVLFWLRARFRRRSLLREIDEELEYHLRARSEELRAEGRTPSEARRVAHERFGDVGRVRERCRQEYGVDDEDGGEKMWEMMRDVRFAVRSLTRAPAFTAAVVLTLAVGIGANSAIFTVLQGVLLQPQPYDQPDELVRLWQADRINDTRFENFSAPDYFDVLERNEVFEAVSSVEFRSVTLTDSEDLPAQLTAVAASHELLDVLGADVRLGRWFSASESLPGGGDVVVLGHGLWTTRYGADPSVIGRTVSLEGIAHEVIGVANAVVEFPRPDVPLWLPFGVGPTTRSRGQHNFPVLARLDDGVSIEQANANLASIASALEAEFADENEGREMWAQPLHESIVGDVATPLLLLTGAVGLVLLIACVNVVNLLLVRANTRERDTAVRLAMGAARRQLVRQLLTENVALGVLGGAAGLALATAGVRVLVSIGPASLPRLGNVGIDGTVLGFTALVSLGTGLVCGVVPAMQSANADLREALTDGGRGSRAGRRGRRLRSALVVTEVAMTVVLASAAGLLLRSIAALQRTDPGFDPAGVVSTSVQLPPSRYAQDRPDWPNYPEVLRFQQELIERLEALPGVQAAAMATQRPTDPGWTTRFSISGVATAPIDPTEEVRIRVVTAAYAELIGMELLRGRMPDPRDDLFESPPVALINEAMASRYFPETDPVGAYVDNWGTQREIIGIVKDVRFMGVAVPTEPAVYPMFAHMPFGAFNVLVKTTVDPSSLAGAIRGAVAEVDPGLATSTVVALDELLAFGTGQARFNGLLLTVFALASLVLAAVGIYGVVSYGVSQRTHEIGVRLSLGASAPAVAASVVRDTLRLTAMGIAVGLVGVAATSRLMTGVLYGVEPSDAGNLVAVVLLCLGVSTIAAYAPARRASRVDPVQAISG